MVGHILADGVDHGRRGKNLLTGHTVVRLGLFGHRLAKGAEFAKKLIVENAVFRGLEGLSVEADGLQEPGIDSDILPHGGIGQRHYVLRQHDIPVIEIDVRCQSLQIFRRESHSD